MKRGVAVWVLGLMSIGLAQCGPSTRVIDAGFWFDGVSYGGSEVNAERLGGAVTASELVRIEEVARAELAGAFSGLRVAFSGSHDARYRVRVVQELRSVLFPRAIGPSGESRGIFGIGGQGAVNFRVVVSNAISYAPPGADRAVIVDAIGRGVGRTAVHEFAHLFLGSRDIHRARDPRSYEFENGDRAAQYYGPMHWELAWPLLVDRLGVTASSVSNR